ncbi:MAG: CBS domain-containing protein, partial [Phycisphaeraceae bacterium]|nr:CBS domain-containing protein [Phycisphaeraceae bacterium]
EKVTLDGTPQTLLTLAERSSRSRFPVLDAKGQVVGVISLYDALARGRAACPAVRELVKAAPVFDARHSARDAMGQMRTSRVALAIVTDRARPVGIVTIKDLVEPITGELASW